MPKFQVSHKTSWCSCQNDGACRTTKHANQSPFMTSHTPRAPVACVCLEHMAKMAKVRLIVTIQVVFTSWSIFFGWRSFLAHISFWRYRIWSCFNPSSRWRSRFNLRCNLQPSDLCLRREGGTSQHTLPIPFTPFLQVFQSTNFKHNKNSQVLPSSKPTPNPNPPTQPKPNRNSLLPPSPHGHK